jgi:hypothetical protein
MREGERKGDIHLDRDSYIHDLFQMMAQGARAQKRGRGRSLKHYLLTRHFANVDQSLRHYNICPFERINWESMNGIDGTCMIVYAFEHLSIDECPCHKCVKWRLSDFSSSCESV